MGKALEEKYKAHAKNRVITADVSEVILNDKKDRIAIIDAIQTANAKELAALSEIKKHLSLTDAILIPATHHKDA